MRQYLLRLWLALGFVKLTKGPIKLRRSSFKKMYRLLFFLYDNKKCQHAVSLKCNYKKIGFFVKHGVFVSGPLPKNNGQNSNLVLTTTLPSFISSKSSKLSQKLYKILYNISFYNKTKKDVTQDTELQISKTEM